jgi:hypothetical protein
MSKLIKHTISIFCFCMAPILARAQNGEALTTIKEGFEAYSVAHIQEKIFVHTDKDFYLTDETIWFKIYAVDGTFHKPLALSKVVYVDVINRDKLSVFQTKVEMADGKGHGSLKLSSMKSGNYLLRAYTRWMRNYNPASFFEKTITIVNPNDTFDELSTSATNSEGVDIQFFPEGGNLVHNLTSRVGFKVADRSGRGLTCSGSIINEKNDTLVRFQSLKFGMGSFSFTPTPENTYRAIVKVQDKAYSKALPQIQNEGYVMQVQASPTDINIRVQYRGPENPSAVHLLAHTRQFLKVSMTGARVNNEYNFQVPLDKVGEGITHFTIFDENQMPVADRLFFKKPGNALRIHATLQKRNFSSREAVELTVSSRSATEQVPANLSLSVFMADSLQSVSPMNIHAYLMLSSDLKGFIESPEYYLYSNNPEVNAAADNLMMTQGWSRFTWKDVLKAPSESPWLAPEYEGIILSGKMTTEQPWISVHNLLLSANRENNLSSFRATSSGKFQFSLKDRIGTKDLVLTNFSGAEVATITLDDAFERRIVNIPPSLAVPANAKKSLIARSIYAQVQEQFEKSAEGETPTTSDTTSFYGAPDAKYHLDNYVRFPTVEEVLREYVTQVIVRKQNKGLAIFTLNEDEGAFFTESPLVMVDGVPLFNHDKVLAANAKNVRDLEVVTRKFHHGPLTFNGIVSLKTFKGDFAGFALDSTSSVFSFEGFQSSREFYAPQYSVTDRGSRVPDFRNVLHWVPEIITTTTGNTQIRFFTSDAKGRFIGVFQGLSDEGMSGTHVFTFDVIDHSD